MIFDRYSAVIEADFTTSMIDRYQTMPDDWGMYTKAGQTTGAPRMAVSRLQNPPVP